MEKPSTALVLVLGSVLGLAGCFGHGTQWRDDTTFVSNLRQNRYVYTLRRTAEAPETTSAVPVVSVLPDNAEEVGIITVRVEHSGWGAGGLRRAAGEFYEDLTLAAQRLGGTHFHVQDTEGGGIIPGMTVSVLRVPE